MAFYENQSDMFKQRAEKCKQTAAAFMHKQWWPKNTPERHRNNIQSPYLNFSTK